MKGKNALGIWISIGTCIGVVSGTIVDNIEIGTIIGILSGLLIGLIIVFRKTNSHDIH
jgi:hypothetical protein